VKRQITGRDPVPKVERTPQPIGHRPTRDHGRSGFEGQSVLDPVLQQACVAIDRLEPVRVLPAGERSLDLDVRELPARDTVAMLCYPRHRHRTDPNLQHRPGSIADSAGVLQQFDRLPRRR
jgi:hypothetical protein